MEHPLRDDYEESVYSETWPRGRTSFWLELEGVPRVGKSRLLPWRRNPGYVVCVAKTAGRIVSWISAQMRQAMRSSSPCDGGLLAEG